MVGSLPIAGVHASPALSVPPKINRTPTLHTRQIAKQLGSVPWTRRWLAEAAGPTARRVNSLKRLRAAHVSLFDSVDGTLFAVGQIVGCLRFSAGSTLSTLRLGWMTSRSAAHPPRYQPV